MTVAVLAVLGFIGFGWWLLNPGGDALAGAGTGGDGNSGWPAVPSSDNDNVDAPNWNMGTHIPITNDPATWPSGDRIWMICHAIAMAEGANIKGSAPDRNNNPGDISDGSNIYGHDPAVKDSNVTSFPTKELGWQWLYNKISNALQGKSSVYLPDMTWIQFAQKYAGNWQAWVTNVTTILGVDPNSTLRQYAG